MKLWKKILLWFYLIAPLTVAFQLKEGYISRKYCELQDEKILQSKYDEGYKAGKEEATHEARAISFKVLIDLIDRSGLAYEDPPIKKRSQTE